MELALFLALGLLAEIIGTVGGFGSSVFFVPIAQLFFDYKVVLGITGIFHVFSNSAKLAFFWRSIDHRLALLIGFPSVTFVILGALSVLPALFIAVSVGGEAAAIFAAMVLLYALARIVRRLAGDGGVMAPVLQRAGALSILIPGAVGFFLTVNGIVSIFAS